MDHKSKDSSIRFEVFRSAKDELSSFLFLLAREGSLHLVLICEELQRSAAYVSVSTVAHRCRRAYQTAVAKPWM